jgi:hypothetical protein
MIQRDNKLTIRNDHAVVVLKNGAIEHIHVQRPGTDKKEARDIEFDDLLDLERFLADCQEVFHSAFSEVRCQQRLNNGEVSGTEKC